MGYVQMSFCFSREVICMKHCGCGTFQPNTKCFVRHKKTAGESVRICDQFLHYISEMTGQLKTSYQRWGILYCLNNVSIGFEAKMRKFEGVNSIGTDADIMLAIWGGNNLLDIPLALFFAASPLFGLVHSGSLLVHSMNRTDPPVAVRARPITTPSGVAGE